MADSLHAAATQHLPSFITAPGDTDMSSRRDFLDTWIVVDLAQQSLTQIKMALAGPNAWNRSFLAEYPLFESATGNLFLTWLCGSEFAQLNHPRAVHLGHEQTYGQYWHDVRLTPESVGGTASTPTACCYKRWDLLTNQCRMRFRRRVTLRCRLSVPCYLCRVR